MQSSTVFYVTLTKQNTLQMETNGDCGSVEITLTATPTFDGTQYNPNYVSGFYFTTPVDTLTTAVQVVLNEWGTSDAVNGSVGYCWPLPLHPIPATEGILIEIGTLLLGPTWGHFYRGLTPKPLRLLKLDDNVPLVAQ